MTAGKTPGAAWAPAEEEEARSLLPEEGEELWDQLLAASIETHAKSSDVAKALREDTAALQKTLSRGEDALSSAEDGARALAAIEALARRRKRLLLAIIAALFVFDGLLVAFKFLV